MVKKELDGIGKQIEELKSEISKMKPEVDKLDKISAEQEELLCKYKNNIHGNRVSEGWNYLLSVSQPKEFKDIKGTDRNHYVRTKAGVTRTLQKPGWVQVLWKGKQLLLH